MVRTYMTARKSTGGRAPVGRLVPLVQPQVEVVEEVPFVQPQEVVEEQPQWYDGAPLEVDADGDIVFPPAPVAATPPQSPAVMVPEVLSPVVEEVPEAPVAEDVPEAPVAEGGDPDDSGDDDGGDDADEDDEEEDPEEREMEEDDEPRYRGARFHFHSSVNNPGRLCVLLEEVLNFLGFTVRPLYISRHFSEPGLRDYYTAVVHIREALDDGDDWKTRSTHVSTAPFSTQAAAESDAARRALWSICHSYRERLFHTDYRHVPSRLSGTEDTVVVRGAHGEERVDILARITAALNTELEGATGDLDRVHAELQTAHARIAQLEAQLAGRQPPQEEEAECPTSSPPRKRTRYGTLDSITRLG